MCCDQRILLSADSTIGFGSSSASSCCAPVTDVGCVRRSRTSLTLSFNCARQAGYWTKPESSSEEDGTADDFAADFGIATCVIRGFDSTGTKGLGREFDELDSVALDE